MLAKSAIAKGKRMEEFVAKEIEVAGLGKSIRTPGSGSGNRFKGDLFNGLPFMFECKNERQTNLLPNIDQAKRDCEKGNYYKDKWSLITRDPRYPEFKRVYATIDFWEFLSLLRKNQEPKIKEQDRNTAYVIKNSIIWLKKLDKILNP